MLVKGWGNSHLRPEETVCVKTWECSDILMVVFQFWNLVKAQVLGRSAEGKKELNRDGQGPGPGEAVCANK